MVGRDALHDGVAPGQRRGGPERREPRGEVRDVGGAPVQAALDARPRRVAQPFDLDVPRLQPAQRVGQHRPVAQGRDQPLLAVHPAGQRAPGTVAQPGDPRGLLREIGHQAAAGVGRGRAAQVGDVVDQRGVGLVADRRDHRGAAGGDGAAERLVGEGQQVFDAAAAAGEHDDVDARVAVEVPSASHDLRHGERTLRRGVRRRKRTAGQRPSRCSRRRARRRDARPVTSPMQPGRNGSGRLRAGSNRPSAASSARSRSIRASSSPMPDGADRVDAQAQRAAAEEERRLAVHDHPVALGHGGTTVADQADGGGELQRHVGGGVAEDEERRTRARSRRDLGELALHPDGAEPVHPGGDLAGHRADGPRRVRRVRRRLASPLGDRRDPVAQHRHVRRPVAVGLLPGQELRSSSTPRWRSLPRS